MRSYRMRASCEQTLKQPSVEAHAGNPKLETSLCYRVSSYHRGKKKKFISPPKPTMVDKEGWMESKRNTNFTHGE